MSEKPEEGAVEAPVEKSVHDMITVQMSVGQARFIQQLFSVVEVNGMKCTYDDLVGVMNTLAMAQM